MTTSVQIDSIEDKLCLNKKELALIIGLDLMENIGFTLGSRYEILRNNGKISYIVRQAETNFDIYEYLQDNAIKIINKKKSLISTLSGKKKFMTNIHTSVVINQSIGHEKVLFGLDVLHRNINIKLINKESQIIRMYGPDGCGKTSLIRKIELKHDDITFLWVNRYKLPGGDYDTKKLYSHIMELKKVVICMPEANFITNDNLLNRLQDLMEDFLVNIKIIITCNDLTLLDPRLRGIGKNIFVPLISGRDKVMFLKNLLYSENKKELCEDGLDAFAKLIRGYSCRDMLNFVNTVSAEYSEKTLVNMKKGLENKIWTPIKLLGLVADIEKVRWTDIGGYEDVKKIFREDIQIPILNGDKIVKGVLLHGPPGCSKTMFARALATECDMNLFEVSPANIMHSIVGESEARLRHILIQATACAPSIVFLDEIDILIPKKSRGSEVTMRLLNQLLVFMEGVETKRDHRVILMAATNKPDNIERALIRPGRINVNIKIGLPDQEARESILKIALSDNVFHVCEEVFAKIPELATKLNKKSGAEITHAVREIKSQCRKQFRGKEDIPTLTMEHVAMIT